MIALGVVLTVFLSTCLTLGDYYHRVLASLFTTFFLGHLQE